MSKPRVVNAFCGEEWLLVLHWDGALALKARLEPVSPVLACIWNVLELVSHVACETQAFNNIVASTLPCRAHLRKKIFRGEPDEMEVRRVCDATDQNVDLPNGEDTFQASTDNVLDGERLGLVDLSIPALYAAALL